MSAGSPPVSIGLPVYNGEQYLQEALDSILHQTYGDFELILGDNGSTDATGEICRAAAASDSRVRYLPADENRGAAWNYNRVFDAAAGRYFRWAAHDDLVAPTYLGRLVETLEEAPQDVVLVQSWTTLIDQDGAPVGDYDELFDLSRGDAAHRLRDLVRHIVMSNVLFGLMRREALAQTRLHGAYPSADYVLLAELAMLGRFVLVPERLFLRRVHPAMSRKANVGLSAVADWFEPGSGGIARAEYWRLLREHLVAIRRARIGVGSRLYATSLFLPAWMLRHRRVLAREAVAVVRPRGERARA